MQKNYRFFLFAGMVIFSTNLLAHEESFVQALQDSGATSQECQTPRRGTCDFYSQCLESHLPCGPKGYALAFGERYCKKFLALEPKTTEMGKQFIASTMSCLQSSLVPLVAKAGRNIIPNPSCQRISEIAYSFHSECYTNHENSFCFLGVKDLVLIFQQLESHDFFETQSLQQMKQVALICFQQLTDRLRWSSSINSASESEQLNFWTNKYNEWSLDNRAGML